MVQPENVMVLMKRYLTIMNRRIDELAVKTSQLELELARIGEKQENVSANLQEKLAEFTSDQEEAVRAVEEAREQMKKGLEKLENSFDGFITYDAITELQSKIEKDMDSIRDEKLDRGDFQEFVDSYFAPLKELFEETEGSESYSEFASAQSGSAAKRSAEKRTPEEREFEEESPAELPAPTDESFLLEEKHPEKKKKKWL